ncbi:hypothetical protein H0H87_008236 [Tephrocybe sp. NHM501043]|nr:hypothetical protein H0H87_008236 [Tephrocybe sp. NHM501043]
MHVFSLLFVGLAPTLALGATPANLLAAGQHVIYSYAGLTPPESLLTAISAGHAAGVIFFKENIDANIGDVVASLKNANAASPLKLPLLLMTDQEGGQVRRLSGDPVQSAKAMCAGGTSAAGGTGAGENLASVGMNVNLAPVLDVYRVAGDFEDQYQRSFSNNATLASSCGQSFIQAQQAAGVASTAKHFPGLGAAASSENTDVQPVTLNLSVSEIQTVDELPYSSAIAAGVPLVMLSWAVYPAIDSLPAGLSFDMVFSELRGRLGFEGVTITDAIEAGALSAYGKDTNRAILASAAGMDLILAAARDATQGGDIVDALATALDDGTLDSKLFGRATARIANSLGPPPVSPYQPLSFDLFKRTFSCKPSVNIMAQAASNPTFIYKLVPSSSPVPLYHDELPERLPVSSIDQDSGFVHLSTSAQLPGTLKSFFADESLVYILRIKYDDFNGKIRWEDPRAEVCGPRGGEGMFPHLYNDLKLGKDEIESVHVLEKGEGGWDAALIGANDWLVW